MAVIGQNNQILCSDLPLLRYTERVIKESMRLFPIAAYFGRYLEDDITIGERKEYYTLFIISFLFTLLSYIKYSIQFFQLIILVYLLDLNIGNADFQVTQFFPVVAQCSSTVCTTTEILNTGQIPLNLTPIDSYQQMPRREILVLFFLFPMDHGAAQVIY